MVNEGLKMIAKCGLSGEAAAVHGADYRVVNM
jgi:hypothetical protein